MEDHPAKPIISMMTGLLAGIHSLLQAPPDQMLTLGIACIKAFIIGGCAWYGQTVASWTKKKATKIWQKNKIKKNGGY